MKYALIVPDGAADRPLAELGGKTPLQVAKTPNLDRLVREGSIGLVRTCPTGMTPGTEVCLMDLMGYDPREYFRGRGPLEALGEGIELKKSEVAFRCNLVTVQGELLDDYSAGHITDAEGKEIIQMLDKRLGSDEIRFLPGASYRHLMIWRGGSDEVKTIGPHHIMGQPWKANLPKGKGEAKLLQMMEDSRVLLMGHEVNRARRMKKLKVANMIWLWSPGRLPSMPDYRTKFGLGGVMITAVNIGRGMGKLAGLEIVKVPGATGYFDTNYKGKGDAAVKALKTNDLAVVHIEAPDEAGHDGNVAEKVRAIEAVDEFVIGALLKAQPKLGALSILVLPDHATPVEVKNHTDEPVPFVIWRGQPVPAGKMPAMEEGPGFDEAAGAASGVIVEEGWTLLDRFFLPRGASVPAEAADPPATPPAA
ncbi:MAG: cofactor-independent phosphoglycerate mutase [Candidatus Coatesbacteria bacterium]